MSYAYNVPFVSFEDSISNTNRATIWTKPIIAATDMFDTSCPYYVNESLYITNGLLTWTQNSAYSKKVGKILEKPSNKNPTLTFLWDPENKHPEIQSILNNVL